MISREFTVMCSLITRLQNLILVLIKTQKEDVGLDLPSLLKVFQQVYFVTINSRR